MGTDPRPPRSSQGLATRAINQNAEQQPPPGRHCFVVQDYRHTDVDAGSPEFRHGARHVTASGFGFTVDSVVWCFCDEVDNWNLIFNG